MSRASTEQHDGIEQVRGAVVELDESTQQNAALVEQISAAAESLREQAAMLAAAVAVFRPEKSAAVEARPGRAGAVTSPARARMSAAA